MPFDNLEGVAMHYVNTQDGDHTEYNSKYQVKKQADSRMSLTTSDSQTDSSQTDAQTDTNTDYDLPSFDIDDSSSCCPNPRIVGEGGDTYELDNNDLIRLEKGEQICLNCDHIHES